MMQATLIINTDDGVLDFHAHSSCDDFQDILVQLEEQFLYDNTGDIANSITSDDRVPFLAD